MKTWEIILAVFLMMGGLSLITLTITNLPPQYTLLSLDTFWIVVGILAFSVGVGLLADYLKLIK